MNDSQQLKRGPVAPFNPNPNWPSGYFQVLEELGVDERRQPFYAHWVRRFFSRQQKMIYAHVLNKGPMGVISPLDTLCGVCQAPANRAYDHYEERTGISGFVDSAYFPSAVESLRFAF